MNGIHQFDLLLLQTHAVELLVGALQTLLGLLGFQEILQTFIKIELSLVGGLVSDDRECQPRAGADAEETITRKSHMASPENKQQRVCWRHHVCSGNPRWDSGFLRSSGGRCRIPRREMEHRRSDHKSLETPRLPSCHNGKISTSPLLSQSPSTLIPSPRSSSHSICTTTAAESIHKSVRTWNTNQLFLV